MPCLRSRICLALIKNPVTEAYASARFECCYDVLNKLTIAGT